MSLTSSFRGGYTSPESWFYDTMSAGSVAQMVRPFVDVVGAESANGPLLDVGCGGGHFLRAIAEAYPSASLHGADYSEAQAGRARARLAPFGDRAQIQTAPAEKLPFADNTFAAVVSIGSIKHWQNQSSGVSEMVRVLRPGGLFAVLELDRGCTVADAKNLLRRQPLFRFLGPIPLMAFRTYVTGLSIDLEDARTLVAELPLMDVEVKRRPGEPALQFQGRKVA